VDLILRASPGVHQLLAARKPAAEDPAALIGHPHRLKLTAPQQARQRPGVQLVRLRPRARDPRVIRTHNGDAVDVRLEDPAHPPSNCLSPPTPPGPTPPSSPPTRRSRQASPSPGRLSAPPRCRRSRSRRLAMHVQANRATDPSRHRHPSPPQLELWCGRTSGTTTQTDTSSTALSRPVAGAAERKARARSPSIKTAYPSAFSQTSPCPGSADPKLAPGQSLQAAVSCLEKQKCAAGPLRGPN
jgi:hypothetical protein